MSKKNYAGIWPVLEITSLKLIYIFLLNQVCANCDFSSMGRILKICRTHPLDFKPTDLNYCPECKSHQLYMVEHPTKEAIGEAIF